jgi:hypothetical protein
VSLDQSITATLSLGLNDEVHTRYRQTGEDDYAASPVTLLELIVEEAARQLMGRIVKDETVYKSLRGQVADAIARGIDARVVPLIEEAFEGPVIRTNAYGEPTGATTTMRAHIFEVVQGHMRRTNNRSEYDQTVYDKALRRVTADVLANEYATEIDAQKATIRDAYRDAAAAVLAAAQAKAAGL